MKITARWLEGQIVKEKRKISSLKGQITKVRKNKTLLGTEIKRKVEQLEELIRDCHAYVGAYVMIWCRVKKS